MTNDEWLKLITVPWLITGPSFNFLRPRESAFLEVVSGNKSRDMMLADLN